MIELKNINLYFNKNTNLENHALKDINIKINDGEFVTIIGGNGAGKSTLMNLLSGKFKPEAGQVFIDNEDVTNLNMHQRSSLVARVFQDPMIGTFADLTIEENMAIALKRGKCRGLDTAIDASNREKFKEALSVLGIGLEDRLNDVVASLSGGQRQSLSLVMATIVGSKILLLDEHTAALDPKIAQKVMQVTDKIIKKYNLTALMITHSMDQAIEFGTRTLMMYHGSIAEDFSGAKRAALTPHDLVEYFK